MNNERTAGASLIAGGLATVACYVVVVWTAVFWNDDSSQVCGDASNSHQDHFFPPYTVCGTGDTAFRATSDSASLAGAALFVVGVAMVLIGIALVFRGTLQARGQRRL
jgi:hypothetical protein